MDGLNRQPEPAFIQSNQPIMMSNQSPGDGLGPVIRPTMT